MTMQKKVPVVNPNPHPMAPYFPEWAPAPIMWVKVRHKSLSGTTYLKAFLDTGADYCVLAPWSVPWLEAFLGELPSKEVLWQNESQPRIEIGYELSFSFDGGAHWYEPVKGEGSSPDGLIEWKSDEADWSYEYEGGDLLIGRDILHQLEFCCDGPAETFTLKAPQHAETPSTPATAANDD